MCILIDDSNNNVTSRAYIKKILIGTFLSLFLVSSYSNASEVEITEVTIREMYKQIREKSALLGIYVSGEHQTDESSEEIDILQEMQKTEMENSNN